MAMRASLLQWPSQAQQWDGAAGTITTDIIHENEYGKVKESQDQSELDLKIEAKAREADCNLEQAKAASARSLQEMEAFFKNEIKDIHVDLGKVSWANGLLAKKQRAAEDGIKSLHLSHAELRQDLQERQRASEDEVRVLREAQVEPRQDLKEQQRASAGGVQNLREAHAELRQELAALRRQRSRSRGGSLQGGRCRCAAPRRLDAKGGTFCPGDVVYLQDRRGSYTKRYFRSTSRTGVYNLSVDKEGKLKHRAVVLGRQLFLRDLCRACSRSCAPTPCLRALRAHRFVSADLFHPRPAHPDEKNAPHVRCRVALPECPRHRRRRRFCW